MRTWLAALPSFPIRLAPWQARVSRQLMTAQQAILSLGTVTLTGCGAGLVLIHDRNPLLKGLNWMGIALVAGGAAAGLMLGAGVLPALEPIANTCILVAFLCCYRADLYLLGLETPFSSLGLVLLAAQCTAAMLQWTHLIGSRGAIVALSLLNSTQIGVTARTIGRSTPGNGRLAARFTVVLMQLLVAANVVRAVFAVLGFTSNPRFHDLFDLVSFQVFVASAILLAFAFFWRTTARLSLDLEHMASTDPLTRVFNRRVFLSWCESEQARSARVAAPFSVLMVDFDHFKRVNDTYGHHVGDQVLCAGVERIQDSIRGIDVLCRWGGEEFAVLLPSASSEATHLVAERIRRNVLLINGSDVRFDDDRFSDLQLSASIGTATYDGVNDTVQAMLQRADSALYEAKRKGRNCVMLAPAPSELEQERYTADLVLEPQ